MLCKEMAEIINTVVNGGYKTMLDKLKNQAYYDQIAIQRMEWKLPSREEL